ncbi:MAG: alpha-2-macroglobulin family protein [Rhodobacteraceae bacterium]|nr:alpha-2-macroglobulin family protein [Paracoccaceae bacterium]
MSIFRFSAVMALISIAFPSFAEDSPIPERRSMAFENTDLYGGDIRTILETTLDICENACLETASCSALTFNETKGACFLKNSAGARSFFAGAISMEIMDTPSALLARGVLRVEDLGFLPDGYLTRATRRAAQIGRQYPVNDTSLSELTLRFEGAMVANAHSNALKYATQMLSFEDQGENWLNVATLASKIARVDSQRAGRMRSLARDAAVNAYMRSGDSVERATAMVLLAQLLETAGEGRDSIDALRLAQRLDARSSTADALDRAIGLFGFRVIDTQVDNNAERPRICVNFNEDLAELGVEYASFVRTAGGLPVEAEGAQLCFDGVTHGQTYQITLREGLPAASGEVLVKSVKLSTYVRDRDPSVHFIGRSYVLPMSDAPAIPVVTVNAEEVELRLSRIGERNLVPTMLYGILNENLDQYSEGDIANERGEELWRGIGEVGSTLNADVITALPLSTAIKDFEPGIYAMTARISGSDMPWEEAATQWFIVTDLGVETMLGADGLHAFARSLRSAEALEGVTARLVASNNDVLFEALTDAAGYAHIPAGYTSGEGGNSPAMLQLISPSGDFAFIDLNEAAMDLSDRGVSGRSTPAKIDIFASFERGAYRPGEAVFATILARNAQVDATGELPLTAVLYRPDGVEASRYVLADAGAGGRVFEHGLSASAMRGTWRLEIHADPDAASLKTLPFLVEDFVPERIDFTLEMAAGAVRPTARPSLSIEAAYLYGAPASGLSINGEVEVTTTRGYAAYPGYKFGLVDEPFINGYEGISSEVLTDDNGRLALALTLPTMEPVTKPLQMRATVRMADGSGRPVERTITREILPDGTRIGIKPLFDGALREGAEAAFEVIAIDENAARAEMENVSWVLSRVERRYQWYKHNGRWNWEPITRRVRVASGELDLSADGVARIGARIDWGRYELKIVHTDGGYTASSFTFSSGWWSADASSDTPDVLDVSLDKARYNIGDVARLRVEARDAGKVLVRVVSDRLISMQAVDVAAGESLIEVAVAEEWGAGAYIIATLMQPMDEAEGRNPARAVGLAYAPTDPSDRMLAASFDMPAEVLPRGPLEVRLKVEGSGPVYATIAAVDVGILNLTGFESPDPTGYYFGQRRLGMELRDIYGRLIDGMQGTPGLLRSGGDGALARVNAPPPTEELIAYFSGPLEVDAEGYATASFDLPAFNGTVRLMAVVWSDTAVGEAEYDLLVRDPVVVTTAMPRFMAPGDESRLRVDIANVNGPAGEYTVAVSATGAVQSSLSEAGLKIAEGGQATLEFPLRASAAGDGELAVVLTGPEGAQYGQIIKVSVRANDPLIMRALSAPLAEGGTFTIDANVFADFQPGSGTGSFALGPLARFDVAGMLDALNRTPWGNTETRISRAMPLLYLGDIAAQMNLDGTFDVQARVEQAIEDVLRNQGANGSFGQWRPRGDDWWLDAFATDFLSRSRAAGYSVPERAFSQALQNLNNAMNYAGDFENGGEAIAYTLMVLAREGQASIGDLRYYADVKADEFATPMALAQLGAALAMNGDQVRADTLFALAYSKVARAVADTRTFRLDYGSQRRDMAALLALAVEAGSTAVDIEALAKRLATPARYYSSQERLWQLMAARALIASSGGFSVDGVAIDGPAMVYFDAETLAAGPLVVQNNGAQAGGRLMTMGAPAYDEPAMQNGYRIERWLYTMDGEQAAEFVQNERYVAILRVTPEQERRGRLIISDPLAAGFEIDNPNLLRSGDLSKLDWLQLDTSGVSEFRADRFLNAVTWGRKDAIQMAYIVRAVTPGVFRQPAALVEDMYRPSLRATTSVNTVTILPAQ